MCYTLTLAIMGVIWVLMTLTLRDRIKKMWLYTLFPLTIYSIPLIYVSYLDREVVLMILVLLIYAYYLYRIVKGFSFSDTLIIPSILIVILIVVSLLRGV